jgi:hypothetical protein
MPDSFVEGVQIEAIHVCMPSMPNIWTSGLQSSTNIPHFATAQLFLEKEQRRAEKTDDLGRLQ